MEEEEEGEEVEEEAKEEEKECLCLPDVYACPNIIMKQRTFI